MSTKLVYEDWFYHTYHLAGSVTHAKDCKVCCWHLSLNEDSRHIHGRVPEYIKKAKFPLDIPIAKV